jgi:hypothetical protein
MKRRLVQVLGAVAVVMVVVALLSGCASAGLLGEYRFRGGALSGRMRTPPEPRVFADYSIRLDRDDPVGSVLSVGTSIAKAAGVRAAQQRLTRALEAVDVPEEIRWSALEECARALGCEAVRRADDSDFLLSLDIREYGIDASSGNASAEFRVDLVATLADSADGREIWRTRVREQLPISPAVFGLGGSMGNVVSAATLAELSEAEIGQGLMKLARSVAYRVADRLVRDLRRARG